MTLHSLPLNYGAAVPCRLLWNTLCRIRWKTCCKVFNRLNKVVSVGTLTIRCETNASDRFIRNGSGRSSSQTAPFSLTPAHVFFLLWGASDRKSHRFLEPAVKSHVLLFQPMHPNFYPFVPSQRTVEKREKEKEKSRKLTSKLARCAQPGSLCIYRILITIFLVGQYGA